MWLCTSVHRWVSTGRQVAVLRLNGLPRYVIQKRKVGKKQGMLQSGISGRVAEVGGFKARLGSQKTK